VSFQDIGLIEKKGELYNAEGKCKRE
jgi:hypothetical protein